MHSESEFLRYYHESIIGKFVSQFSGFRCPIAMLDNATRVSLYLFRGSPCHRYSRASGRVCCFTAPSVFPGVRRKYELIIIALSSQHSTHHERRGAEVVFGTRPSACRFGDDRVAFNGLNSVLIDNLVAMRPLWFPNWFPIWVPFHGSILPCDCFFFQPSRFR